MNKNFLTYSILAFPLSFIGLPIYVHIANFYVNQFALSVFSVGILIFISRFIDMIQDPIIGQISDNLLKKGITRKKIIGFNSPFLAFSFYFLFNPPNFLSQVNIMIWFVLALIAVYTFFSIIVINYNSIAAEIAKDYSDRTKITSIREFIGLIGVLSASISPTLISKFYGLSQEESLSILAICFLPILLVCSFVMNKFLKIDTNKSSQNEVFEENSINAKFFKNIGPVLSDKKFQPLLFIFFINSIAVSLPASTFLFFVEDVLKAKQETGIFLLIYFFCAALALPFWNFLAKKIGKKEAWILSIFLSIVAFFWAFFITDQTYQQFYIICLLSGLMLGADLAIPPSILADIVNNNSSSKEKTSSYFAIWNSVSKMALALASSVSLIFLGLKGFRQENAAQVESSSESLFYLSLIYALIPCLIKVFVIVSLLISKIDKNQNQTSK